MAPLELSLSKVGHHLLGVGTEDKYRMSTAIRGQDGERPQDGSTLGLPDEIVGMDEPGKRGFVLKLGLSCVCRAARGGHRVWWLGEDWERSALAEML